MNQFFPISIVSMQNQALNEVGEVNTIMMNMKLKN